jgi:anti-sigma regulatory factor (Ser/Thr protein kinase)
VEGLMRLLRHLKAVERSQVSEARRIGLQFAAQLGFDETLSGAVAVVTTELANNLVTHAKAGEVLLSTHGSTLNVLAVDRGPGMNVDACLRDGFSTAGTAGTGLGAIRRLAHQFEAYSTTAGTIVSVGFGPGDKNLGVARAPKHGETACGDSWSVVRRQDETWVLVADGLGHGEFAAAAAEQAVVTFEASRFETVASVVQDIHLALRPTRGAAIAVARVGATSIEYCGLGNISGVIHSGASSINMVSMGGTAGLEVRKINPFTYRYNPGATLIMHSDGLQTQWALDVYPGIMRYHPSVVAGALFRDYTRGRDDVTVLVLRT